MPDEEELTPADVEESRSTATLDEDDAESEEEQTWEDEYEDKEGESTAPTHHGPGITIQRFRCKTCGHVLEKPATGTAYDDLPPVHHNQYMTEVGEEEAKLPLEDFLERAKRKQLKSDKAAKGPKGKKPAGKPKAKGSAKAAKRKKR